ncbi:hypothetical protein LSTR_LSTR013984 [Laodelphax striatellus]|uniref:Protein kinase domain-containing protein n=1 Tax=Laodelphax striatellus TaxID=195883 RepID=A0A482XHI1_LAOST|nr:hypothetical protein LSTR_LSTR013984 [Laodelphax striatellus]
MLMSRFILVYLLDHEKSDGTNQRIQLACKLVDASKAPKDFVRKFLPRELDILVRLNHPHIIHVHSIFQKKHKYFIVMRFAENGDLLEYVLNHGEVSEERSRFWIRQMALAVQYLHEMGIAHRDLKCENILITELLNCKLADFGFARFVIDETGAPILSATYCGSLTYAAPEVLRGLPYDPKISDMWSLGVILYVMFNKSMPFDDANVKKMYERQMNKRVRFRTKVVDKLTTQAKVTTFAMLEPMTSKRMTVDELIGGEWVAMDPKLRQLNALERSALEQARATFSQLQEKAAAARYVTQMQHNRPPSPPPPPIGHGTKPTLGGGNTIIQEAISADQAGLSKLNVIMQSQQPAIDSSNIDTTQQ